MKFLVIELANKGEWNNTIFNALSYDFYHCHSYNCLEKQGEPVLLKVEDGSNNFIALPLVIRDIPGTGYFDCTSVYGYPGPVANRIFAEISESLKAFFKKALLNFFEERKIVAAFTRLHPIIPQECFFKSIGEIVSLNQTVGINLTLSAEEQRRQYRKSNKSEINQLKKKGYEVKKASTAADVNLFIEMYIETMRRVNASEYYFFDGDYFHEFLNANDFENTLLLARKDNQVAAGAIFTSSNTIMQYHLAGTKEKFIFDAPMKLIIDEARLLGNQKRLQYLHLGGGVGGSDSDSLFRFKSGFSDTRFTYKVWKIIVNNSVYEKLVSERRSSNAHVNTSYFPLYRG